MSLFIKRSIIIVESEYEETEYYSSLVRCCDTKDNFNYGYLKRCKLPMVYKECYLIKRVPLNSRPVDKLL